MHIKIITSILAIIVLNSTYGFAQKKDQISVGTNGIKYSKGDDQKIELEFAVLEIGFNSLRDNTDYTSPETLAFLKVPQEYQNENLFDLISGKSVNVNIWLVLAGLPISTNANQKIYISSGAGLQFYNFRFNKQVTYANDPTPSVYIDSTAHFTKNKLALSYLSIPLGITFKTRVGKQWLVYGVGATGGYRLASWMKQKSPERGKQKLHDSYNFKDFNACLTAEIGIDNILRLYGSYQVTALHENALEQYPLSIGIRLGGI